MHACRQCGHDTYFFTIKSQKCFRSSPAYVHASLVAKDIIDVHFIEQERSIIGTRVEALAPKKGSPTNDGESPIKLFRGEIEAQDTVVTR